MYYRAECHGCFYHSGNSRGGIKCFLTTKVSLYATANGTKFYTLLSYSFVIGFLTFSILKSQSYRSMPHSDGIIFKCMNGKLERECEC